MFRCGKVNGKFSCCKNERLFFSDVQELCPRMSEINSTFSSRRHERKRLKCSKGLSQCC